MLFVVGVTTAQAQFSFVPKVDYATGSSPVSVAIGDLNGDGKMDLAVANVNSNTVSVLTGTGSGFGIKVDYPTGSSPYSLSLRDFNGDG